MTASPAPPGRPAAPVRAVLFDVDDTLYLVADLAVRAWDAAPHAVARLGLTLPHLHATYAPHAHLGVRAGLAAAGHAHHVIEGLYAIAADYHPTDLTPLPGAADLLTWLRERNIAIAAVTNGTPRRQAAKLAALGVLDLLDLVIICDGRAIPYKPSHVPFTLAMHHLGVPAEQTLMVGDRPGTDLAPALEVGMRAARIRQGSRTGDPDLPQAPTFTDLRDLAPHLHALCATPAAGTASAVTASAA